MTSELGGIEFTEAVVLNLAGRYVALDQFQGDRTATLHMRTPALSRQ